MGEDAKSANENEAGNLRPLRCPYCADTLTAELVYTASYSEHRDLVGFECDNYACNARWKPNGDPERGPTPYPWQPTSQGSPPSPSSQSSFGVTG